MNRLITQIGQSIYEWFFTKPAQDNMVALGKLSAAVLGTAPIANGLACTPTSPATLQVTIGAGELYALAPIEASVYGTLPADTTHQVVKQGISLDPVLVSCAPPPTGGQAINYLIQVQYQDQDVSLDPTTGSATPVVLQFFNSSNPSQPWQGPNNSGQTSNTFRKGVVAIQAKAGIAAATGSQVTPAPDGGWTGLWVVTVANGQTTITAGNITPYSGAPVLPSGILQSIITSALTYGIDNGTANVYQATFPVAVSTLVDGMEVWVKIKTANTSASTFTPNAGVVPPSPVVGAAHAALQGGEFVAGGRANLIWRQDISSWVLAECTGGAQQVAPATAPTHAVQYAQVASALGAVNARAYTAAASSFTLTADRVVAVTAAAGGLAYATSGFSKAINLATTGAGGMDTGSAPALGYVAIYAIYNPTTTTWALLATNATSTAAPEVYAGANMPSGYTASCLVSVWATTSTANQFRAGLQRGRHIAFPPATVLSSTTPQASYTALSISSAVPPNAIEVFGNANPQSSAASTLLVHIAGDGGGTDDNYIVATSSATGSVGNGSVWRALLSVAQTIYYSWTNTGGSPQLGMSVVGYIF